MGEGVGRGRERGARRAGRQSLSLWINLPVSILDVLQGFFDAPKPVSNKRSREEEEHERRVREREAEEEDEMEEAEEEEEQEEEQEDRAAALDRMLDEAVEVEAMDLPQLKRNLLALERKVMKNQEMRVRHADEPSRFMDRWGLASIFGLGSQPTRRRLSRPPDHLANQYPKP
jgi:hypothetical protein